MAQRITLGDLLHKSSKEFSNKPLLTQAETGETISYAGFEQLSNQVAHGLIEAGKTAHGYIGIMLENSISYLAATYALKKLNIVEVSINRAFRSLALARMINLTECQVLFTSKSHFEALQDIVPDLPHIQTLIVTDGLDEAQARFPEWQCISFEALLSHKRSHIQSSARDSDVAAILFSSGTTGISKGCLLSHRYAVRTAENMITPFRLTKDDVNYTPYPLSHIGPAYYDFLATMMTGGHVILRERFSLSAFWPEMVKYKVTWFMMLGSVQQLLWSAPPCPEEKQHNVTRCWSTPAPVPKADFDKRFGLHLVPGGGYGSTDAGWVVVPQWDHSGGIVLPHFDVKIVDEHDDIVPAGVAGEIVIRPNEPHVMSDGYYGMAEKTVETWRNLWFHTGDIGKLDDEGRFYFICRMAERIRVKGEMVSGFEVEEVVLMHPSIEDAAVIGTPAKHGEEDIVLFITLREDCLFDEANLRQHCQKHLAKFMVPSIIKVLDEMPRTPTGKPEKGKLASYPL